MADQISICNMALAEIAAEPIDSLNEQSLQARECSRAYPQALSALLEGYEWGFAIRREALAIVPNPRPSEWAVAYALPDEVLRPIKIVPASVALATGRWWVDEGVSCLPYVIEDGVLFTHARGVVIAFVTSEVTSADLPARFVDALTYEIAQRIAYPITKNRALKGDLIQQAEVARQRAIADDANRQPIVADWRDEVSALRLGRDGWASEGSLGIPGVL